MPTPDYKPPTSAEECIAASIASFGSPSAEGPGWCLGLPRSRRNQPSGAPITRRAPRVGWTLLLGIALLVGDASAQVWPVDNVLLTSAAPMLRAYFGGTIVVGDFDGDGHPDIVVGEPWYTPIPNGAIDAFHGEGAQRTFTPWGRFVGQPGDRLGGGLAVGDFDGDGVVELAAGAPGAAVYDQGDFVDNAGAVEIYKYFGYRGFLLAQTLSEGSDPAISGPVVGNRFGSPMAAGDLNGDGFADLAVGIPDESDAGNLNTGAVEVFYGGVSGLRTDNAQRFRIGHEGVIGTAEFGDQFGLGLVIGDFDGDGFSDLAIGAPNRLSGGQVYILRGSSEGVTTDGQRILTLESLGGAPQAGDWFGAPLAAGYGLEGSAPCRADRCPEDLVIGAQGVAVNSLWLSGEVLIAHGGPNGPASSGATVLNHASVGGEVTQGEAFGVSIAVGTVRRLPPGVTAAFESLAVAGVSGTISLMAPGAGEDGRPPPQQITRAGLRIDSTPASGDWGLAMAIVDFDGDAWGDLAVGAPINDVGDVPVAGAVEVLFGGLFADGFEDGGTLHWTAHSP